MLVLEVYKSLVAYMLRLMFSTQVLQQYIYVHINILNCMYTFIEYVFQAPRTANE